MTNIMNKVRFSYEISENQNDLFTRAHVRYKCVIRYEGKRYTFEYQCNPSYVKVNKRDCLSCLFSDASCVNYTLNVDDFLREFGYTDSLESVRNGEKAYKACKRTEKALKRVFGADYETLAEELNDD